MTEVREVTPPRKSREYLLLAMVPLSMLAAILLAVAWAGNGPLRQRQLLCDKAIQDTLKAPSTYRRVKMDGIGEQFINVEYDAENSFGVPLRGHGSCEIDDAQMSAKWVEYPDTIGRMN